MMVTIFILLFFPYTYHGESIASSPDHRFLVIVQFSSTDFSIMNKHAPTGSNLQFYTSACICE